jgi:hypothetical protein
MQRSRRAVQTHSPRVAALLAALIALALPALGAGAAHAAAWLPGPTLTQSATAFAPPQTAVGADGGAAVLSTELGPFGSPIPAVVLRRLGPDGAQLGPLSIGRGYGIDVVALPGGGYRVAWVAPGPPTNRLMVATVDAAGRVAEIRPAASVEALNDMPVGALAADGSAVIAWMGQPAAAGDPRQLRVLQVAADGTAAPVADLGPVEKDSTFLQLVRADDGGARLLWERPVAPDRKELMVGRVSAAGVGEAVVLGDDVLFGTPRLAVGGGDPVVVWATDSGDSSDVLVRRLPSSGAVADAPTRVVDDISQLGAYADVALAADGTATVVWTRLDTEWNSTSLFSRQLAPSGALGPAREISPPTGFVELDVSPQLEPGRDGTFVVQWFRGFPANDAVLNGFSKVLDSSGAAVGPELPVPYTMPLALAFGTGAVGLTVAPSGHGLLVGAASSGGLSLALHTARFDGAPPALDPAVPAAAVRGTAAAFAARASDPSGIARVTWQFGDGASAEGADVTHVYGAAGPRTVTVTATDAAGESATVTRELTVSEPAPGPGPRPGPGGGPGPAARRASARLRVTKAVRRGARVTVAGTLDRRARGRVTVTWAQRSGRRTVRQTVRVRIARGRFAATIRLPRTLARARVAGRLTVTYAGDTTLRRATVTRTVRAAARRAVRGRR